MLSILIDNELIMKRIEKCREKKKQRKMESAAALIGDRTSCVSTRKPYFRLQLLFIATLWGSWRRQHRQRQLQQQSTTAVKSVGNWSAIVRLIPATLSQVSLLTEISCLSLTTGQYHP